MERLNSLSGQSARHLWTGVALLAFFFLLTLQPIPVRADSSLLPPPDLDFDGDVDQDDIDIILAALNSPAGGVGIDGPQGPDLRDRDSDGTISVLDVRLALLECTRDRCATQDPPPLPDLDNDGDVDQDDIVLLQADLGDSAIGDNDIRDRDRDGIVSVLDLRQAILLCSRPACSTNTLLLVDDDSNAPDVRGLYTQALDALGIPYDIHDTNGFDNEPDAAQLAFYDNVIWFTGAQANGFAGPGPAAETALGGWLDNGGCLTISSQGYLDDRGVTGFMQSHLGVAGTAVNEGHTEVSGSGFFTGLGPFLLSYPFPNLSDRIVPDSTAQPAFTGSGGTAGISKSNGISKSVFAGFPLEALPTSPDRQNVMQSLLDFCAAAATGRNDLVIDLGSGTGLWARLNNATWEFLHNMSPDAILLVDLDDNGQDDIVVDFGDGIGLWVYMNNSSFTQLHSASPKSLHSADLDGNNQADLIVDFGDGIGLWTRINNGGFVQIHPASADNIIVGDVDNSGQDDLIIDFGPGSGVWIRLNDSIWQQLHGISPGIMIIADVDNNQTDDIVLDLGPGVGLWIRLNNANWSQLHPGSAEDLMVADVDSDPRDDIIVDFGAGAGVWVRLNNSSWSQIHGASPEEMAVMDLDNNGSDDVILDLGPGTGLWARLNNSSWQQIHTLSSSGLTIADLDSNGNDDLIVDLGSGTGLWAWMNNNDWNPIHSLSPDLVEAGNIDGQ